MTLTMLVRTALAALSLVLVTAVSNCGAETPTPVQPGQEQGEEDGDDDGADQGDDGAEDDDDGEDTADDGDD